MGRDLDLVGHLEEKLYQINNHAARRLADGRYANIDEAIKGVRFMGMLGRTSTDDSFERRIRAELPAFVARVKNESST